MSALPSSSDVLVLGAGHNGLVAAVFLARAGLRVTVVDEKDAIGGACKTERPFPKAPNLATSTGAYLLGLMPPELVAKLGVDIPLAKRDPHYFLPTQDTRYLLFGSDRAAMKRQFLEFFSERDWRANEALTEEIAALREDVAPAWLREPLTVEGRPSATCAPRSARPSSTCAASPWPTTSRASTSAAISSRAMYAVTDGFSGIHGTWSTPGTGMNFLDPQHVPPAGHGRHLHASSAAGWASSRRASARPRGRPGPSSRRDARSSASWSTPAP